MGSTFEEKKKGDDIEDSGAKEYKEVSYKLFKLRDYQVKAPNGEFRCPFCSSRDEDDFDYTHLLQHAIRVAEGSISGKQRGKHAAMARYLAVDLAGEAKPEHDEQISDQDWVAPSPRKRSRSDSSKVSSIHLCIYLFSFIHFTIILPCLIFPALGFDFQFSMQYF